MVSVGVREQDGAQPPPIEPERRHLRLEEMRVALKARINQDQPLGGGAGDLPLREPLAGRVPAPHLLEQGVAGQQEVDLEPLEVADLRDLVQGGGRHNQLNLL